MIKSFTIFVNENIEKKDIIKLLNFPNGRQCTKWSCGASVVQMVLQYYGIDVLQNELIEELKTNEKTGTKLENIIQYLEDNNFKIDNRENMTIDDLKHYINKNIPIIILMQAWKDDDDTKNENTWKHGHYTTAIGYTDKEIILSDSSCNNLTYVSYNQLLKRWHDKDNDTKYINYGIAVYGKKPKYDRDKILNQK